MVTYMTMCLEDWNLLEGRKFFAASVTFSGRFEPSITSAELAAVTGPEIMILRLVIIGENLFEICLGQCIFEFGFPFGQVVDSQWPKLSKLVCTGRNGCGQTDSPGREG
jgi:hypothetical protein